MDNAPIEMGDFAKTIMEQKYSHTLPSGKVEDWNNISYRVSKHVMKAVGAPKELVERIRKLIRRRAFIPGGRYLYATGRAYKQTQNCALLKAGDSREGWSGLMQKATMALMTGAGIGVDYCLDPNTPVLLSNLRWKSAGKLEIGDSLIGFEEELNLQKGLIKESFVESVGKAILPCYRITTEAGSVVTSSLHKWVCRSPGPNRKAKGHGFKWQTTENLKIGDEVGWAIKPWEQINDPDLFWLGGVLDGEGWLSVSNGKSVLGFAQKNGDVLNKALDVLIKYDIAFTTSTNLNNDVVQVIISGKWARLKLLSLAPTVRLIKKARYIWNGAKLAGKTSKPKRILSIEFLGAQEVTTLQTSTRTLIAGGFYHHNSDIRAEGKLIRKTGGTATGPIALMQMVNEAGRGVMQGGSRRCLPDDTLVTMADGKRKMIKDICVEDMVATRFGPRRVSSVFDQGWQEIVEVGTTHGKVRSTPNHRWLSMDSAGQTNWVMMSDLSIVNRLCFHLQTPGGVENPPTVIPVTILSINRLGVMHTYDIEVEEVHEFFADNFVSHNSAIWSGLSWRHADIHKFIRLKDWSVGVRKMKEDDFNFPATMDGTNISVILDDLFFKAYHDEKHELHGHARSVYWAVVEQMLKTGEPGFSVNTGKNSKETLRNAPLSGNTWVLTSDGYVRIRDIVDEEVYVWTGKQFAPTRFKKTGENVPVLRVSMSGGRSIVSDPSHEFFLENGEKVRAENLKEGMFLKTSIPALGRKVTILSVSPAGFEDVFCCDVGVEEHSFVADGVIVSNCTEICSEDTDDICNLGSINMAQINSLEEMEEAVELGVAFLLAGTVYSDVPYTDIDKVREKNRRLGLGLMGIHEWLLLRGKKYGPDEELEEYMKIYAKSTEIAHKYAEEWELSKPIKTRAVAPNGTTGIVAETTTGMEPVFCVALKRRYRKGPDMIAYQYIIDPTAQRLIDKGVNPDLIEDAYTLAENVERRVEFQVWLQKFVDHSISSTINLPEWGSEFNNSGTVQNFGKMLIGHLPELRGITCYPDGARGGQPLTPVKYSTAIKHIGEVFYEQQDVCDLTKAGNCG